MDHANDTEDTGEKAASPRRLSISELSLTIALALAIIMALALSFELLQLLSGPFENDATSGATETSRGPPLSFPHRSAELPEISFTDGDGKPLSLRDFRGRPILLNIWATWCVPCRKEMPSLDRLQAKFDPSRFLVLTLSIDHLGIPVVRKFYQELGLKSLGVYVDQSGAALNQLMAPGVPTTLFVNADGQEIGRKIGPAEWDSPQTIALLRQHLRLPAGDLGTPE